MEPSDSIHKILKTDPLGRLSRKERTILLLISIVAIAVSRAGLVPTKIVGFGVEFANIDRSAILWLLAASVLYFMVTFASYAVPDFLSWQVRYKRFWWELANGPEDPEDEPINEKASDSYKQLWKSYSLAQSRFLTVTWIKIGLDLGVPVVVGSTAIIIALKAM